MTLKNRYDETQLKQQTETETEAKTERYDGHRNSSRKDRAGDSPWIINF
jgi:hypothetical protein